MEQQSLGNIHESVDSAIGVDLGGTKISAARVWCDGRLSSLVTLPTCAADGPEVVLDQLAEAVIRVGAADGARSVDVGIGSAGAIDPAIGRVVAATGTMPGWAGTDLAGGLRRRMEAHGVHVARVRALNDVDAHAAGEAWLGAGRGRSLVLMVAVGTGVGGAIVVDGRPLGGRRHLCGEIGRLPGQSGTVDEELSGPGILRAYQARGGRAVDTREVFAASETSPLAREVVWASGDALGRIIGGLCLVLDPDVIVLGGGVGLAKGVWRSAFEVGVATASGGLQPTPICTAELGQAAGILGAARGIWAG